MGQAIQKKGNALSLWRKLLAAVQIRTQQRTQSRLRLTWVGDGVEESSLPTPKKTVRLLEPDSWYSAQEEEEGQETCEGALEELAEEQDLDSLRDLIVNLCPSVLKSLQDVSKAEKILRSIHRSVEGMCSEAAHFILRSVLGLLSECCPKETVESLLRISPSCDNAALAMWEMLLSLPSTSESLLDHLLSVIQGWRPKCAIPSASQVLYRLSQRPRSQGILEALFPRLLMSSIYKLSLAVAILGEEQPQADQPEPLGVAVEGIKVLLCAAGWEGHVQSIQQEGGWDMMCGAETLESGVGLLAREMRKIPAEPKRFLFQHMKEILTYRREWQMNFAMTFYAELLGCQDLRKDWSDLHLLHSYLSHGHHPIRLLALGGLAALLADPRMAREMRESSLLDTILMCLKDPHTDIRMEALLFFQTLTAHLKRKEASPVALLMVEKLPLLFGDESSQVQELSLSLFEDMLKAVVGRDKGEMKETLRRVVVSLILQINTESRSMAEASGRALLISAKFLRWRKVKKVIKKKKTWLLGETLLKQDKSRVEDYVCFSLPYLCDPRASVRAEAIRFMGTAAQRLGRKHCNRTLEVVWDGVKRLADDPDASVRSLAAQTSYLVQTARDRQRPRWSWSF
ncbi:maestro heat-like repeat-containing protein family member 7 [Phaethornis superciliosus]